MKRKKLFQSIALSSLLLSSVASPAAFAETNAEANAGTHPAIVKAMPAIHISTSSVLDPIKLAEQYAPDTVDDWEQTLAEFEEALKSRVRIWTSNDGAAIKLSPAQPAEPGDIPAGAEPLLFHSVTLPEGKAIKLGAVGALKDTIKLKAFGELQEAIELKAVDELQGAIELGAAGGLLGATGGGEHIKTFKLKALSEEQLKAAIGEPGAFWQTTAGVQANGPDGATEAEGDGAAAVQAPAVTVSFSTNTESLQFSPFAKGWSELHNAVESKDADAIKQALAHQLTLYKQEIAALKERPADDGVLHTLPFLAAPAVPAVGAEQDND